VNLFVLAVSIIAYLIILIVLRRNIIVQQLMLYFVYIVSVTYYQGLDIALPLYFVFSLIPFIGRLRRIDVRTFLTICILGAYLVVGMCFQNTQRAITMFISRCWQFLFFFVALNDDKDIRQEINYIKILYFSVIAELVLAAYLFFTKRSLYAVVRLTAGAQPITGNTAVVVLPIIIYCFLKSDETKDQTRLIVISFIMALFVALSGTRGYELIYGIMLVWMIWLYIFKQSGRRHSVNRFILFSVLAALVIGLLFIMPQYAERVFSLMRLNKRSIGIRTYENKAAIEFFLNAPARVKLFGVGLGGRLGSYSVFQRAIYKQFSLGMWNQSHYLNDSGALFHNLYMNILCNMGIVGLLVFAAIIVRIWRTINRTVKKSDYSIAFKLLLIGFLLMNYYRWSTDCGIAIFGIFALILKKIGNPEIE